MIMGTNHVVWHNAHQTARRRLTGTSGRDARGPGDRPVSPVHLSLLVSARGLGLPAATEKQKPDIKIPSGGGGVLFPSIASKITLNELSTFIQ